MKKEIAKPIIYSLYGLSILLLVVGLVVLRKNQGATLATIEPNHAYNILQHLELPVVADPVTIGKPYTDTNVKIVQNYYDYKGTSEEQRESLIYYEDTYMQSSGVSYSLGGEQFDAIAVLDGEVVSVKEDPLLGNSVTIKHSSSMQTIYQSIQDIQVKEGDTVKKGMLIGKSGEANINKDLGNHLYFELVVDNISVNPEEYYDKTL